MCVCVCVRERERERDGLYYVKASQMQRRFLELLSSCSGRRRNTFGGGPVKVFNSAPAPVSFAAGPDLCVCECVCLCVCKRIRPSCQYLLSESGSPVQSHYH